MKVSIVIPLYNKERHIRRSIDAVLRQTYGDFEVIVVDDGSTDGGADIVREYDDPRVRLVSQENLGVSAARNRGIEESNFELIAFLDADDEWETGYLEAITNLAARFPQAGLYATGFRCVFPNSIAREILITSPDGGDEGFLFENYFRSAKFVHPIHTSSIAIPRKVLKQVGLFLVGVQYGEDVDMWGRIALTLPIAYHPRVLSSYHCDADARLCNQPPRTWNPPPFIKTGNEALQSGNVPESMKKDLREFIDKIWFSRIIGLIQMNQLEMAKDILENEFSAPGVPWRLRWLRWSLRRLPIAIALLPLRVLFRLENAFPPSPQLGGVKIRRTKFRGTPG